MNGFFAEYKFIELIKTVGLCPTTLRFFEKNRVKLLSKRNYIAFFGKKYIELFQKYHGSAMVFYKSLGQAFSKACGVLGQRPKVLHKFKVLVSLFQKRTGRGTESHGLFIFQEVLCLCLFFLKFLLFQEALQALLHRREM